MNDFDKTWRNAEGYSDPTAGEAIKNIEEEQRRLQKLLKAVFTMCDAADFYVEERIVLRDKRTGKIWR